MALSVRRPDVYAKFVPKGSAPVPADPTFGGVLVGPVYDVVEAFPGGVKNVAAAYDAAPSVEAADAVTYAVGAKTLKYKTNGGDTKTITFPGGAAESLSKASVRATIDAQGVGIGTVVTTDGWAVSGDDAGDSATLQFLAEGTATVALGLSTVQSVGRSTTAVGDLEASLSDLPAILASPLARTVDTASLRFFGVASGRTVEFSRTANTAAALSSFLYATKVGGTQVVAAPYGLGPVDFEPVADGGLSRTSQLRPKLVQARTTVLGGAATVRHVAGGLVGCDKSISISGVATSLDTMTVTAVAGVTITGTVADGDQLLAGAAARFGDELRTLTIDATDNGGGSFTITLNEAFATTPIATNTLTVSLELAEELADVMSVVYEDDVTTWADLKYLVDNAATGTLEMVLAASTDETAVVSDSDTPTQAAIYLSRGRDRIDLKNLTNALGTAAMLITKDLGGLATVVEGTNDKLFLEVGFSGAVHELTLAAGTYATGAALKTAIEASFDTLGLDAEDYVTLAAHATDWMTLLDPTASAKGVQSYIKVSGSFAEAAFDDIVSGGKLETFGRPFVPGAGASLGVGCLFEDTNGRIGRVTSFADVAGEARAKLDASVPLGTDIRGGRLVATNLSEDAVAITDIPPALVVGSSSFTLRIRELSKSFVLFSDFRALRTDLAEASVLVEDALDVEAKIGTPGASNPVALALVNALAESEGMRIGFRGVPSDDAAGYEKAIMRLERGNEFYIGLASNDADYVEILQSYLTQWAARYNYKRGIVGVPHPTEKRPTSVVSGLASSDPATKAVTVTLSDGTLLDAFNERGYSTTDDGLSDEVVDGGGFYVKVVGDPNFYLLKSFTGVSSATIRTQASEFAAADQAEGYWFGSDSATAAPVPPFTGKTCAILRRTGAFDAASTQEDVVEAYDHLRGRLLSPRLLLLPNTIVRTIDGTALTLDSAMSAATLLGWKVAHNPADSCATKPLPTIDSLPNLFGDVYVDEDHWDQLSGFVWLVQDTPTAQITVRDEMTPHLIDVDVEGSGELYKMEFSAGAGLDAYQRLLKTRLRPRLALPITERNNSQTSMVAHMATIAAVKAGFVAEAHILGVQQSEQNKRKIEITVGARPAYPGDLIEFTVVVD